MDKEFIFSFLKENPVFHLANVHHGKPYVRALLLYDANESGIIFHTSKSKDLYKQLTVNQDVELCFLNEAKNMQIRISGAIEFIEDETFKKEIVEKRKLLQPWILHHGLKMLAIMRLTNGLAQIWEPELTFLPKRYVRL
jgi:uncharacterized pyridoxamine 5'-phosphate oxidase family protein